MYVIPMLTLLTIAPVTGWKAQPLRSPLTEYVNAAVQIRVNVSSNSSLPYRYVKCNKIPFMFYII